VAQNSGLSIASNMFSPGGHVKWFAARMGWPLRANNILVEGNDSGYFEFAADLFRQEHNRDLLAGLAIFPTGDGDAGGTDGILRHFPTFRSLIDADVDMNGMRQFQAIVLLDCDSAGKNAKNGLTAKYTVYQEHRDVFLLQRRLPRTTRSPTQLGNAITRENEAWKRLDCEIEDLLSLRLLEKFVANTVKSLRRNPVHVNGAHHFEFNDGVKSALLRFVRDNACINDVELIVDVLKSLRYYMGLSPDGDPVSSQ
jgi:hypothetical protein